MSRPSLFSRGSAGGSLFCCLLLLSIFLLLTESHAADRAKLRLAVVGPDATEPVRTLFTAALSQQPGVEVLERAEVHKIADELSLQTTGLDSTAPNHVGQLLHADALLLLTPDPARKLLTVRLVAVAPGVVLFQESLPLPVPGSAEWAPIEAQKLAPYLGTLHHSPAPRIPLSILRIRAVSAGWDATHQENELGFLLTHRLMNDPALWVLERTQMTPLEWEKALQDSPSAFWTGSYLLDGTLNGDAQGFSVTARLRSPRQGKEIALTARGKDLRELADALAGQLTTHLQTKPSDKPWDAIAEARQFQEEALWAHRWKLYAEASEAAESAWALGARNNTLALLRFSSEANRLGTALYFSDVHLPEKPIPGPTTAPSSSSIASTKASPGKAPTFPRNGLASAPMPSGNARSSSAPPTAICPPCPRIRWKRSVACARRFAPPPMSSSPPPPNSPGRKSTKRIWASPTSARLRMAASTSSVPSSVRSGRKMRAPPSSSCGPRSTPLITSNPRRAPC